VERNSGDVIFSFWDFAQPRLARIDEPLRRFGPTLLFVLVTLVALSVFRGQIPRFYPHWVPNSAKIYLPLLGMLAIAIAFYRTKYTAFVPLLSAILRASAVGLTVLLLIERSDYTLADPETATRAAQYVALGFYLAVGLSALSWFRPAFILPVVIYLMSTRLLVAQISGVWMSYLDTRYMMDMAFYLIAFGLIAVKAGPRIHPWLAAPERQTEIVGVVFGLHLANYFWSGVAKLTLGPTPWHWMVENPTINQIPYTLESGILPIGHLPWLTDLAYQGFHLSYIPMNAAIVLAQLFTLVCVLRVGWLKIASLMYEALHIGIFILGGLFFWPWVWSNLTVWWAARRPQLEYQAGLYRHHPAWRSGAAHQSCDGAGMVRPGRLPAGLYRGCHQGRSACESAVRLLQQPLLFHVARISRRPGDHGPVRPHDAGLEHVTGTTAKGWSVRCAVDAHARRTRNRRSA
jgi:hypothetical protein